MMISKLSLAIAALGLSCAAVAQEMEATIEDGEITTSTDAEGDRLLPLVKVTGAPRTNLEAQKGPPSAFTTPEQRQAALASLEADAQRRSQASQEAQYGALNAESGDAATESA